MKKYLYSILVLIISLTMTSCKNKETDYHLCGLYLEFVTVEELDIKDRNAKIFIDFTDNNIFKTDTGNVGFTLLFESTTRTITETSEYKRSTILTGTVVIPQNTSEQFTVRFITEKDQQLYIGEPIDVLEVKKTKTVFQREYLYEKEKYYFQMTLSIKVKE